MISIPDKDKAAILLLSLSGDACDAVLGMLTRKEAEQLRELMRYYAEAPDLEELVAEVRAEFEELSGGDVDLTLAFLQGNLQARRAGTLGELGGGGGGAGGLGGGGRRRGGGAGASVGDRIAAYQFAYAGDEPDIHNPVVDDLEVGDDPIKALQALDGESLTAGLRRENPSAVAIVLHNLKPQKAAEVLGRMSPEKRKEVFVHMAGGLPGSAELNRRIVRSVVEHCVALGPDSMELNKDDQYRLLAEVLQTVDQRERVNMLGALELKDREKAAQLDEFLFEFDDLLRVEDRALQRLLAGAEVKTLATALSDAPHELIEHVVTNLSERVRKMLEEEMEFQGAQPAGKVEDAQREITELIRAAEKDGTLRWRS